MSLNRLAHSIVLAWGWQRAAIAFVAATGAYFYSQQPSLADSRAMILAVDPTPLVAVTKSGERSFSIEVAYTSAKREAGLRR